MGRRPDPPPGLPDKHKEACQPALVPAEDGGGALPHWAIPPQWTKRRTTATYVLVVPVQDPDAGAPVRELPPPPPQVGNGSRKSCGRRCGRGGKDRFEIRNLLADGRCTKAVLDFLHSTDVGRRAAEEV